MAGFGGVAEYGITVRWDKNFLKIIRLLLERRRAVRDVRRRALRRHARRVDEDAVRGWASTTSRCAPGAGRPTVLEMPNGLARGVRTASDFLMALQLTGAAKRDSIANLQIRLPVVVIGGGLTAIDTATESLAYYPVQVEKFLARYEALERKAGRVELLERRGARDRRGVLAMPRIAQSAARRCSRPRRAFRIAASPGAASTIAYRRRLIDSPSYTLNHEEVEKALEEGIRFAEGLTPTRIEVDEFGHARRGSVHAIHDGTANGVLPATLPCVHFAAGTQPNTVLAREEGVQPRAGRQVLPGLRRERRRRSSPSDTAPSPGRSEVLLHRAPRRALHELLRRPASLVLRQRGQGDGQR